MAQGKQPNLKFIEFNGIRITPGRLVLKNAYLGKQFKEKITFQNIGTSPIILSILPPNVQAFKLDPSVQRVRLCSGLATYCKIRYHVKTAMKATSVEGWMPIVVNNQTLEYYISVRESTGNIYSVPRSINFGIVNLEHSVNVKIIELRNKGFKTTKFDLDLALNELDLVVIPKHGFIPAKGTKKIRIEFIGFQEGIFFKEIWVKCNTPFNIMIAATVITPKLYIGRGLRSTENFYFLNFFPVYGACTSYRTCSFINFNTLRALFVVVPEINDEVLSFKEAQQINRIYECFTITPIDGSMQPDEEREIEFSFTPKQEVYTRKATYFLFFRIIRLSYMDVDKNIEDVCQRKRVPEKDSATQLEGDEDDDSLEEDQASLNQSEEDVTPDMLAAGNSFIRLCMYITIEALKVQILPEFINVGKMVVNTVVEFEIKLTNRNNNLPIFFVYQKSAFVEVKPSKGKLNCTETKVLSATFIPRASLQGKKYIPFQFYYPDRSDSATKKPKHLQLVGIVKIPMLARVTIKTEIPKPRFNMGITPMVLNEVGFLTDNIRFDDDIEKPRQAMVDLDIPLKETAIIAFPNDMGLTLRPTNKDEIIKTIFARLPRYINENDEYRLTIKELSDKNKMLDYYKNLIRDSWKRRNLKSLSEKDSVPEIPLMERCFEDVIPEAALGYSIGFNRKTLELSPIQMFFIKLIPEQLDIGKVALGSITRYKIKFRNYNEFSISINLRPLNSRIQEFLRNLPQKFLIGPMSQKIVTIELVAIAIGKFNTIINGTVNNHHYLPIIFKASIVPHSLLVSSTEVIVQATEPQLNCLIHLTNTLNVPVQYCWNAHHSACFIMKPRTGIIPTGRTIVNEIIFIPNFNNKISSKLSFENRNGVRQTISATLNVDKIDVVLNEQRIEEHSIPLNLPIKKEVIIMNRGHTPALFTIRNPNPCPGVTITPTEGIIPRRSYQILQIDMLLQFVVNFEYTIEVVIHFYHSLFFGLSGTVEFPHIVMKPEMIHLRRISAGSLDIHHFTIENKGNSLAKIEYKADLYPEFVISTTAQHDYCFHIAEILLEPGEKETLCIKYFPVDVSMTKFYIPFVINGMLGPASYSKHTDVLSSSYLGCHKNEEYSNFSMDSNIHLLKFPAKLPLVTVESLAVRQILRLSRNYIKFEFLPHENFKSFVNYNLLIKNTVKDQETEFLIRIDDLAPYFTIDYKGLSGVSLTEVALTVIMEPKETKTFPISFNPKQRGTFLANLPLYVRGYSDGSVYNYITLKGFYPPIELVCESELYIQPMPCGEAYQKTFKVTAKYHFTPCNLKVISSIQQIKTFFPHDGHIPAEDYVEEFEVTLQFSSDKPISFYTTLLVTCDCGGKTKLKISGCADNCIITTHMYEFRRNDKKLPYVREGNLLAYSHHDIEIPQLNQFHEYEYPYYCSDNTDFNLYMNELCTKVERWLFEQIMHGKYYFVIPNHMSDIFCDLTLPVEEKNKVHPPAVKKQKTPPFKYEKMLVIVFILSTLLGDDILSVLLNRPIPDELLDQIHHFYSTYANVLKFLDLHGAFLPHVRPQFLLNYCEYVTYESKIRIYEGGVRHESILDAESFYLLRKQCWLDLILQIFRVLVLPRLCQNQKTRSKLSLENSLTSAGSGALMYYPSSDPEENILLWLTLTFNNNREAIMKIDPDTYTFLLNPRDLRNFCDDFSDGLVLIALILQYCPYLEQFLKPIYVRVDAIEKAFHNAAKIVLALKMIKCSFHLAPSEITHPYAIQMLMFCSYAFEMFPYLQSKTTINFKVSLSKTKIEEITLKNINKHKVYYNLIFLNNDLECFTTNCGKILEIPPQKSVTVILNFQAKKMSPVTTTLIFCGEVMGEKYAKNIVFTLEGETEYIEEHELLTYRLSLYSIQQNNVVLTAPYAVKTSYNIKVSYAKPSRGRDMTPCIEFSKNINLKLIHINDDKFYTDSKGIGELRITICSTSLVDQEFWIFFFNRDLGDFFIRVKLRSIPLHRSQRENITVNIPKGWHNLECLCQKNKYIDFTKCPTALKLAIPCRNYKLWNTLFKMFMLTVKEEDNESWKMQLDCEGGIDILNWLLNEHCKSTHARSQFQLKERSGINYTIITTHNIKIARSVDIEDVKENDTIDLIFHLPNDSKLDTFELNLKSDDGVETRMYLVRLVFSEPIPEKPEKCCSKNSLCHDKKSVCSKTSCKD